MSSLPFEYNIKLKEGAVPTVLKASKEGPNSLEGTTKKRTDKNGKVGSN